MVLDRHVFAIVSTEVDDVLSIDSDLAAGAGLSNETTAAEVQSVRSVNAQRQKRLLDALEVDLARLRGALDGRSAGVVGLAPDDLAAALPLLATTARALVTGAVALRGANICLASIVRLLA